MSSHEEQHRNCRGGFVLFFSRTLFINFGKGRAGKVFFLSGCVCDCDGVVAALVSSNCGLSHSAVVGSGFRGIEQW